MHAPLGVPGRYLECGELIAALEQCHAQGMYARWTGKCNDQKSALNACLRQERIDRTTRNREDSKERNRKKTEAWAALAKEKEGL